MNYRLVLRMLGVLLALMAAMQFGVDVWQAFAVYFWHNEKASTFAATALTAGGGLLCGGGLWLLGMRGSDKHFGRREALLLVSLAWLLGAVQAALPFWVWAHTAAEAPISHPFRSFVDCYFEAMSGLTTAGSSILHGSPSDIESLPRGLLLWRSLTHWLGGLGIVVLFVAVFPSIGVSGKKLFHVESAGPQAAGVRPRIAHTARILWISYLTLTCAQILALRLAGVPWFSAVCETFGTIATGGFSVMNSSIAGYRSAAVEWIVIVFMILGGVNFGLYYHVYTGKLRDLWRDTEFRVYLSMLLIGASVVVVALSVNQTQIAITTGEVIEQPTLAQHVRYGVFNLVSMHTDTGFATADFSQWPALAIVPILVGALFGGCAGSTCGGLKVVRVWIVLKTMFLELRRAFRPFDVQSLRVGSARVDMDIQIAVISFVIGFLVLLFGSAALLVLIEGERQISYGTAWSACLATLCTAGPGLGKVGPAANFAWLTPASKLLLTSLMILGRLEIFTIVALFLPGFWRSQ